MYAIALKIHHYLPYVVLFLLLFAIIRSVIGRLAKIPFSTFDNRLAIGLLAAVHLQFVAGVALYLNNYAVREAWANMKAAMADENYRYITVEHPTIMVLSVLFITLGRIVSKRAAMDEDKFRRSVIFYSVGLIFIIAGVPWEKLLP